jgi:hypothetical protein
MDFYKYASAGPKTVTATVYEPGTSTLIGTATATLTVQASGTCGDCSYSLSPTFQDFPAAGGAGTFNVATNGVDGDRGLSQLDHDHLGQRHRAGTVNYSVDANSGRAGAASRRESATHDQPGRSGGAVVRNDATSGHGGDARRPAVFTSTRPTTHLFTRPASRSSSSRQLLQVPQSSSWSATTAALSSWCRQRPPRASQTVWRSDLEIFNPCSTRWT